MAQFAESEKGARGDDLLSRAACAEREARALLLSVAASAADKSAEATVSNERRQAILAVAAATVTEPDPPPRARSRCARGVVRRGGGTQMAHRLWFSTTTPSQPNLIARTS